MPIDISIAVLNIHDDDHSCITVGIRIIKAQNLFKNAYLRKNVGLCKILKKLFCFFLLQ